MNRRRFLRGAGLAALGGPWFLSGSSLGRGADAPSDRVTVGCIGVGGRGWADMTTFLHASQVVAVADPLQGRREAAKSTADLHYADQLAKGNYKGCAAYRDFRDIIARDDIDAVAVCTPDHWHAIPSILAAKSGKDVFCEKPLSLTVAEGRAICNAVKRYGRIFQHGTQRRCEHGFRFACELVRNGRIGKLHTVRVTSEPSHACGNDRPAPVPQGFDYDLWLGPAPWVPFSPNRVRTPYWYWIADYTIGFISGQGVHFTDVAQWGIDADETGPVEIEGRGEFARDGLCDTAIAWNVEMRYANGLKLVYSDDRRAPMGVYFEGTEGEVYALCGGIDAKPHSLMGSVIGSSEIHLHPSGSHIVDFIQCVRSRRATAAPVEAAHRATSICHLAHIAILTGRKLRWDPAREVFPDDPDANRLLSKATREPWRV